MSRDHRKGRSLQNILHCHLSRLQKQTLHQRFRNRLLAEIFVHNGTYQWMSASSRSRRQEWMSSSYSGPGPRRQHTILGCWPCGSPGPTSSSIVVKKPRAHRRTIAWSCRCLPGGGTAELACACTGRCRLFWVQVCLPAISPTNRARVPGIKALWTLGHSYPRRNISSTDMHVPSHDEGFNLSPYEDFTEP